MESDLYCLSLLEDIVSMTSSVCYYNHIILNRKKYTIILNVFDILSVHDEHLVSDILSRLHKQGYTR